VPAEVSASGARRRATERVLSELKVTHKNDEIEQVYAAEKAAWEAEHPDEPFPPFVVWLYFHLGGL
jgi:hypothetical protein